MLGLPDDKRDVINALEQITLGGIVHNTDALIAGKWPQDTPRKIVQKITWTITTQGIMTSMVMGMGILPENARISEEA